MFRYSGSFSMFDGEQVKNFLEGQKRDIKSAIEQVSDDVILNCDVADYVDELFQDHTFECPVINFEGVYVSDSEELISSEQFPPDIVTRLGESYPVHVICYHLPFTGDEELFQYTPSQFSLWFPEVFIEGQEVCFEIKDFRKDMEAVKREAERIINSIKTFSGALIKDVEMYGVRLDYVETLIQTRKQRLINNKNMLASLGVPIKQTVNLSMPTATADDESEKGKRTAPSPLQTTKPIEVFYSYSRNDERYRNKLDRHLSSLKRQGLITGWYDRDISAGEDWEREINKHLNTAQIILLLVSPDFMASDYCYSIEMKRALERNDSKEARVIPIILRPTDWMDTPLGKLKALPTDGRPTTNRSWHGQDAAFFDIEMGIKKVVKEMLGIKELIVENEEPRVEKKTKYNFGGVNVKEE